MIRLRRFLWTWPCSRLLADQIFSTRFETVISSCSEDPRFGSSRTFVHLYFGHLFEAFKEKTRLPPVSKMSYQKCCLNKKTFWSRFRRVNKFRGRRMTQQLRKKVFSHLLWQKLITGCFESLLCRKFHSRKNFYNTQILPELFFFFWKIIFV